MAIRVPDGRVTQGDYEGKEIHVWVPNVLLKIVSGSVYTRPFVEAGHIETARIEKSTVERYQLVSSTESNYSPADYGMATFFFGMRGARALADSTHTYTVAIYFKNGKKCVAELNSAAYQTLTSACFSL